MKTDCVHSSGQSPVSHTSTQTSWSLFKVISPPNLSSSAAIPSGPVALRWADFSRTRLSAMAVPFLVFLFSSSSLYSSSQCSFHLWHTWSGSVSLLPVLLLIITVRGWKGLVSFSLSGRQVCCYLSSHYLPLRRTAILALPICLFAAFLHLTPQSRTVLLLCIFFRWAGRCRWRSSFCVFLNRLFVLYCRLCSIKCDVIQLLPQRVWCVWFSSCLQFREPVGYLDLIFELIFELISSEYIKVQ